MSAKIIRHCATCGVEFAVWPYKLREGKGKYCSKKCEHPLTDRERFESHVDRNGPVPIHRPELGPCAIWTAHRNSQGYGNFTTGSRLTERRSHKAHRYAFFLEHARWPNDCALHACDNPSCVRPSHLFEGTRIENNQDRDSKGRHRSGGPQKGDLHFGAKLKATQIPAIRAASAAGESAASIARRLQVSSKTIGDVLRGKNWSHVA
jgi:hypothetical protein